MSRSREFDSSQGTLLTTARVREKDSNDLTGRPLSANSSGPRSRGCSSQKQQRLLATAIAAAAAAAAAAASNGSKLHSMCEKRKNRAEGFNDLADDVIKVRLWLSSPRYSIVEDNEQKRIPERGVGTC
ncbi:hypothetical protein V1478_017275 [Vespula squamosa]|uniref:Uncharacterized protein n=1 Tax=Vespula squamosa TaxID=30214 RepID=A0ABD1ZY19_VESSQ